MDHDFQTAQFPTTEVNHVLTTLHVLNGWLVVVVVVVVAAAAVVVVVAVVVVAVVVVMIRTPPKRFKG